MISTLRAKLLFQDADYFLQVTQTEEDRLQSLCSTCERELLIESLPEEGKLQTSIYFFQKAWLIAMKMMYHTCQTRLD